MTDPRQTAAPEICAQWDWCPYCKNGLDTGLQCDQCLADLMPVQEALRELQRLRSPGGASGCGHHGYISQDRALEMVAQLGDRKPTETGEYTMGWNTAIDFAVNVLKGIPSTAPEPCSKSARAVVNEQAEDDGLWFQATTITEDYLQKALRRLHAAVEESPEPSAEPVGYLHRLVGASFGSYEAYLATPGNPWEHAGIGGEYSCLPLYARPPHEPRVRHDMYGYTCPDCGETAQMDDAHRCKPKVTEEMVTRFLGWKLPQTFAPDGGVTFKPPENPHLWPVGTNLLTATEARAMLEHVLGGPSSTKDDKP